MNRSIQEFGVRPGNAGTENAAPLQGDAPLTVSLVGCRMRNYAAAVESITARNPHARIETIDCI